MMLNARIVLSFLSMALLLAAGPAHALIAVKTPVDKLFRESRMVLIGKVSSIGTAADKPLVNVDVVESLRSRFPAQTTRIQIVKPVELAKDLSPGSPVVVIMSDAKYAIHMGDRWLTAEPLPNNAFRVVDEADLRQTFPGRTETLAKLFKAMRTRLNVLLNSFEDNIFKQVKPLGKLPVADAQAMAVADVDGDKKPDLLVQTADCVRVFLNAEGKFGQAAVQLPGGGPLVVGDLNADGRPDVLAGGKIHVNEGGKFNTGSELGLPPADRILTAAIADVSGTKRRDIVIVQKDGQLTILQNPGSAGGAWTALPARTLWGPADPAPVAAAVGEWDDDGRAHLMVVRANEIVRYPLAADGPAPADAARLTGERMGVIDRENRGLAGAALVVFDSNADGRADLLAVNEPFGVMLVYRGFGAFFASSVTPRALKEQAFKLTPKTLLAAGDFGGDGCDDLVVLTEAGELYLVDNPPHVKP